MLKKESTYIYTHIYIKENSLHIYQLIAFLIQGVHKIPTHFCFCVRAQESKMARGTQNKDIKTLAKRAYIYTCCVLKVTRRGIHRVTVKFLIFLRLVCLQPASCIHVFRILIYIYIYLFITNCNWAYARWHCYISIYIDRLENSINSNMQMRNVNSNGRTGKKFGNCVVGCG
jgi:hypothetical protein